MKSYTKTKLDWLNVYLYTDDSDCEGTDYYVPVMSERHALRIAGKLGWYTWDQGQGGRYSRVSYNVKRKHLQFSAGWSL